MQQSQANGVTNSLEPSTLNFFADREEIGVNADSGGLKERMQLVRYPDVYQSRHPCFDEIANCLGISRELQAERQIVEGSQRNNGESNIGADQSSGHLSNRPVATHDHDQVGVLSHGFGGLRRQIQLAFNHDFHQRIADRFQALPNP